MLITALAMSDIESRSASLGALLRSLVAHLLGRRSPAFAPPLRTPLHVVEMEARPVPPSTLATEVDAPPAPAAEPEAIFPWRRHPLLLTCAGAPPVELEERRARTVVVRALFNARCGDYDAARLAFAQAARSSGIDLAAAPGFWQMPRAGLTAAVLAYEDAGRLRDAAALAAEINHRLRPRPLHPTTPPARVPRATASGD